MGKRVILDGERKSVRSVLHQLAASFCLLEKRVLIVDSTNSLNPHHLAFSGLNQRKFFRRIYCVRTPLPYDLWARLKSAGSFIKNRKIDILIIISLSLIFRDGDVKEVKPMIENIFFEMENLNEKFDVSVIVGNSPSSEEIGMLAYNFLVEKGGKGWVTLCIQ
jgi:hypothetical protein